MLLRRGDRGPAVADLKDALASLQLLPSINGADRSIVEFDAATDGAIRNFQQRRGLIVDGIVGPVTVRSLTDARWTLGDRPLTHTLSAPMTGDDVMPLQTRPAEMGYNTGRPQYLREYQLVRQAGPRLSGKRIVIDPAHGAEDAGWTVGNVRAGDLTYDIALRLQSRMVTTGMNVSLTRAAHQNPSAEQRAGFANDLNADLLLSLHIDGSTSPQARGIATL